MVEASYYLLDKTMIGIMEGWGWVIIVSDAGGDLLTFPLHCYRVSHHRTPVSSIPK